MACPRPHLQSLEARGEPGSPGRVVGAAGTDPLTGPAHGLQVAWSHGRRAHPLPEPPLHQVALGYVTVHLGGAHRGGGRPADSGGAGTVESSCLGNRRRRLPGACVRVGRGRQPKPRPIRGCPGALPAAPPARRLAQPKPSGRGRRTPPAARLTFCSLLNPVCQLRARDPPSIRHLTSSGLWDGGADG